MVLGRGIGFEGKGKGVRWWMSLALVIRCVAGHHGVRSVEGCLIYRVSGYA
jgi:hypothetical protein